MKQCTADRSRIMRAVKGANTTPELRVRCLAHKLGYRFRLYQPNLPGKPDLTFSRRRKIIFVHGCFWHGHRCPRGAREPVTNASYWQTKIQRNRERDRANLRKLRRQGWAVMVLWECQLKSTQKVE